MKIFGENNSGGQYCPDSVGYCEHNLSKPIFTKLISLLLILEDSVSYENRYFLMSNSKEFQ